MAICWFAFLSICNEEYSSLFQNDLKNKEGWLISLPVGALQPNKANQEYPTQFVVSFSACASWSLFGYKYTTFWFLWWLQFWCLSIRDVACCKFFFKTWPTVRDLYLGKTNWIIESHLLHLLLMPTDSLENCCLLRELCLVFLNAWR